MRPPSSKAAAPFPDLGGALCDGDGAAAALGPRCPAAPGQALRPRLFSGLRFPRRWIIGMVFGV